MKKVWRGFCLVVFLIGLISFPHIHKRAIGSQVHKLSLDDAEPAESFVAKYVNSRVDPGGTVTVTGSSTRYVKANGEWREVIIRQSNPDISPDHPKRVAVYRGTVDGVYEKKSDPASRRYVSESANQQIIQLYRSHNYLRSHPEFVRTEQVAGLITYVLRTEVRDPANQQEWIENSYSPKTGLNPLRLIMHFRDGSEIRDEALSVEFTEVPETLNDDLKAPPIKQKEERLK